MLRLPRPHKVQKKMAPATNIRHQDLAPSSEVPNPQQNMIVQPHTPPSHWLTPSEPSPQNIRQFAGGSRFGPTATLHPVASESSSDQRMAMTPLLNLVQSNMNCIDALMTNTLAQLMQQNQYYLNSLMSLTEKHKTDIENLSNERAVESERRASENLRLMMEMSDQRAAENERREVEIREFLKQMSEGNDARCMKMLDSLMASESRHRFTAASASSSEPGRRRARESESETEDNEEDGLPARKKARAVTKKTETGLPRKAKKTTKYGK